MKKLPINFHQEITAEICSHYLVNWNLMIDN